MCFNEHEYIFHGRVLCWKVIYYRSSKVIRLTTFCDSQFQQLYIAGVGYCFSASLPPFLASAAMEALNIMEKEPTVFSKVRENAVRLHKVLKG